MRYMTAGTHEVFHDIVRGGILSSIGMVSFADVLTEEDADAIHDYIIRGAHLKYDEDSASPWWARVRDFFYDLAGALIAMLNS